MATVTLHPKLSEQFEVRIFRFEGEMAASITIDEAPVIFAGGAAFILALGGAIAEAIEIMRSSAREELRMAHGQQALPDALDAATLADALAGWAPGELAEAYGS